tara:strand:- start:1504 stop:2178 length:675 start_codon:yes stop_codon:yes gene_type:complete
MSDSNHDSAELFDKTDTEVAEGEEDAASTTEEAEPQATSEAEESTEPKRTAEEARADQLKAWKAKILAGKANLEDAPGWMQDDLQKTLPTSNEDLDALVEAKLDARLKIQEEETAYNSMRKTLNERRLDDEQKSVIMAEFEELVKAGLPKHTALEKAVKIAKVPNLEDQMVADRQKAMSLPKAGGYTDGSENKTWDNFENLGDDDIADLALKDTGGLFGYHPVS